MATLSQIAAQAGVSEATVSRVLNDKPGVSEDSRRAVMTALDILGYERPERLRRRSGGLVGLVVPELANPIFPAFAEIIEDQLTSRSFTPVLCTQTPGGVSEDEYLASLLDHGVAGIIFISGRHADTTASLERYSTLLERGLPVVFVNGYAPGLAAPFVSADDRGAVGLAVDHLAGLGHRRVGLAVGQTRYVPALRKQEGFVSAVVSAGLCASEAEAEEWVVESLFTIEGGAAAASALMDRGATAIVCASDIMALGAISAVRARGLRVPEDVSVIGYDDSLLLPYVDPPLTTMRQPVDAMATAAVNFLVEAINGTPPPPHEYVFRTELIARRSAAPPPA